ncbi:MAG: type VII toxin-antitoxin system HepT family RNase toxin [Gemmatimonadota bacterium]
MLRPEFVERKLQLITDDLGQLAAFQAETYESLIADVLKLAAVERILERIILRAIDVNEHLISALATGEEERTTRLTYRDTFLRLADYGVYSPEFAAQIAPSAGLRNILVHEYNDVDHRIVFNAIQTTLRQYADYVEQIRCFVDARTEADQ